ncbi:MAG: branched-chain amino acid ABC transporter permease [Actinomycetota bacterium]
MIGWWNGNQTLVHQIGVYAIAAASMQIAMNAGVFSLLTGATWIVGAYTAAITVREGGNELLAFVLAIVIGAVSSAAISVLTRRLVGIGLAMVTMSLVLITGVILESVGSFTGGPLGLYGIPVLITTRDVLIAAGIVAVIMTVLERGRIGRAVATLREDPHIAASVGIPVPLARHIVMFLSGALAGLSGALYAFMFLTLTPMQGGFDFVLLLLSMVIIGGAGSWIGAYVGAALLIWLPDVSTVAHRWDGVMYGVILIAIVVYAPGGLTGIVGSAVRKAVTQARSIFSSEPATTPMSADSEA